VATPLKRPIERVVESTIIRGRPVVFRATNSGIEIKRKGEQWTSAYLVPWETIYHRGAALKAAENKPERKTRLVKRGILSIGA